MLNFEEDAAKIFQRMNTMPLEHFDGFSAEQMHMILYDPFAEESPIPIRSQIDVKLLDLCPIFQIAKHLMAEIDSSQGIKLTSTGNLPPKIVKEIYERKYLPDRTIDAGITKLSNETRWTLLHCTKVVMKLAKLVRVYKGKLLLTQQARQYVETGRYDQLFMALFEAFTTRFNWAYNDGFENEDLGQVGFLYLLYLLNKHGKKYREISFYADLYFEAFPVFKTQMRMMGMRNEFVLAMRFFERFAYWFGLVKAPEGRVWFDENIKVKRTKLLIHLLG